ncbi:MAG: putative transposase [Pseudomonadota bacterium]|jgi:putative transposase
MDYRYGSHTIFKIQYWARSYFYVTSGELTEEMIKNYLEHHFEPKGDDNFKTED